MKRKPTEWTDFFNRVFDEVKKTVYEENKLEEDGSGPAETLALRKVVADFPCPVKIVEIQIDIEKHGHIEDKVCQIVQYDFSKLGVTHGMVKYYGIINAKDSRALRKLLIKDFGLNADDFNSFYKDFKTTALCDDQINVCIQFSFYNITKNFRKFVSDFLMFPFSFFAQKIWQENRKSVEWNSKFNVKPDPILPLSKIAEMDETLKAFLPVSKGEAIKKLQKDICDIQLIPNVPEDVTKVFRHAKNLHIYGFFCYNFYAIAQHYAYLTLESAIKNRYYQSFEKENILTNKKGETVKIGRFDHQRIIDFCRRNKGWNARNLKINNEKFSFSQEELLEWLVKKKIITMWEKRKCKRGINLRNRMSHLTSAYVFPPGYSVQALEFVSDLINRMYSTSSCHTNGKSDDVFPLDFSPYERSR